jgi:hypothetical protein
MQIQHPLINKESSKHYNAGDKPAIAILEDEMSIMELIAWCKGNIRKYQLRRDYKGQRESDIKKESTYRAYMLFLAELPVSCEMKPAKAYKLLNLEMVY